MSLYLFVPQLIEDLRKQLEHLQLYKLEAEAKRGRSPGAGLQEYQTRTREAELEQEIKRLKQVRHIFWGSSSILFAVFFSFCHFDYAALKWADGLGSDISPDVSPVTSL